MVEVVDWPTGQPTPRAELREILGAPGDNDTEMQAIAAEFGFPLGFSRDALDEANRFTPEPSEQEAVGRRDFRSIATITIDPVDARDFDDALSLRKLGADRWELGVHIADVSHYVQSGSVLDREARERATSVYLVDRVMPMLPEHLSNLVCSLRPDEDKLAFSAVLRSMIRQKFSLSGMDEPSFAHGNGSLMSRQRRLLYGIALKTTAQQTRGRILIGVKWCWN